MKVNLGKNLSVDLVKLLSTRLLVQANSGGGKSWLLRKLLEETHGKVQQIVLDIEGDFSSLREKYDFILAGKGGDIPADPKSAELLARKILELKSDLIVDLYELKQPERIRFVRLFLDSMINAPKSLWGPCLIVLDEAHIFAPEKGSSEAMSAVIDMATRGRKRGFCLVMATQRLSKLHKDAAAEMNNKLIGRTGLDIDVKRASDELGMTGKDAYQLRRLDAGDFFAYGPAISNTMELVHVGEVETRHPKAGKIGKNHTSAPSSKVKAVLAKLSDLPQEAAEEIKDREQLRKKVKDLEATIKLASSSKYGTFGKPDEKFFEAELKKRFEVAKRDFEKQIAERMKSQAKMMKQTIGSYIDSHLLNTGFNNRVEIPKLLGKPAFKLSAHSVSPMTGQIITARAGFREDDDPNELGVGGYSRLGICERKILGFLNVDQSRAFSKVQVGAMTGYAHSSGGFNNSIAKLLKKSLILRNGGNLKITFEGIKIAETLNQTPHTLQDWINKLGACEKKVYAMLLENPSDNFSKEQIGEVTGYQPSSGGFNNAISRLSTLGLLKREQGRISINPEIIL